MLDEKSIDVISRFKLALLTRSKKPSSNKVSYLSNRGRKLPSAETNPQAFTSRVVEYDGSHHLVLTNEIIERTNYRNKRRWRDFYRSEGPNDSSSRAEEMYNGGNDSGESEDEDSDDDKSEENPLKRIRLSEILAPLAHPSELSTHPAISKTFKLASLAVLASELIETIKIEQNTLNQYNKLLQVLDGEDWFYQLEENMELPVYDHGLDDTQSVEQTAGGSEVTAKPADVDTSAELGEKQPSEAEDKEFENKRITRATVQPDIQDTVTDPFFALPKSLAIYELQQQKQSEEANEDEDEYGAIQQELTNYLQVSIQRQNEYIKNLTVIRNGLVKADRYKKDLLRWGKEMGERK